MVKGREESFSNSIEHVRSLEELFDEVMGSVMEHVRSFEVCLDEVCKACDNLVFI